MTHDKALPLRCMRAVTHRNYSAGHPWYYLLGGDVPRIKAIRADILASDCKGYLAEDIGVIAQKQEPQRSIATKAMRQKLVAELCKDISTYRKCARELRKYRQNEDASEKRPVCAEIHVSMSLKHNHIYNGFANLRTLAALPEQQLDLFR